MQNKNVPNLMEYEDREVIFNTIIFQKVLR